MTKVLKKLGLYAEPKAKSSNGIKHKMCESGQIEFFLQHKGFITEVVKSICLYTRGFRLDFSLSKIPCIKIINNSCCSLRPYHSLEAVLALTQTLIRAKKD